MLPLEAKQELIVSYSYPLRDDFHNVTLITLQSSYRCRKLQTESFKILKFLSFVSNLNGSLKPALVLDISAHSEWFLGLTPVIKIMIAKSWSNTDLLSCVHVYSNTMMHTADLSQRRTGVRNPLVHGGIKAQSGCKGVLSAKLLLKAHSSNK